MTDPITTLGDWQTRQEDLDEALGRYEYHAAKATKYLLEAFALDTAVVDRLHPHLRRVNVPTRKPNPDLNPAFSTIECELSSLKPIVKASKSARRDTHDPHHVPLTEEERLMPYEQGGWVGMPRDMAAAYGIPWREIEAVTWQSKQKAEMPASVRRALDTSTPQPWKDSK